MTTRRLHVLAIIAAGYVYIGGVIAVLIALAVVAAYVLHGFATKIILAVAAVCATVLRSLVFRVDPPSGTPLARDEAPVLFETLGRLRRSLRAPPIHRVVVSRTLNASITQIPRFGVLGWQTNYLEIGLPLLIANGPRHFEAVLAHEYAHLARAHGRSGAWIYRTLATWQQLARAFVGKPVAWFFFGRFFQWYAPYVRTRSLALSRSFELEADRLAADLTSPSALADLLVAGVVHAKMFERTFWPSVFARLESDPEPPADVYSTALVDLFNAGPSDVDRTFALSEALHRASDSDDSHPSLRERLVALEQLDRIDAIIATGAWTVPDRPTTAAAHYLGAATWHRLSAGLDRDWQAEIREEWTKRHATLTAERRELVALDSNSSLTVDARWRRAQLTRKFHGRRAAILQLRELLAAAENHAPACFALGTSLLAEDDADGISCIARAMDLDPEATVPGCAAIVTYLERHQAPADTIDQWRRRASAHQASVTAANEERAIIKADDTFAVDPIAADVRAALLRALSGQSEVLRAYLVRKVVRHLVDQPFSALVIERPYRWFSRPTEPFALISVLTREPAVEAIAAHVFVIDATRPGPLVRALRATPGALIYDRKGATVDPGSLRRPVGPTGSTPGRRSHASGV